MILIAGHEVSTAYETLTLYPKQMDTIVLMNPQWKMPSFITELSKDYIAFEFWDTTNPEEPLSPKKHHIEEILKWSEGRENILVACHMGISRSSAIAMLIATTKFGLEKACDVLNPSHFPNRLILRIGGEMLGLPIYETYVDWVTKL